MDNRATGQGTGMTRLPWLLAGLVPFLQLALLNTDNGRARLVVLALLGATLAAMHPRFSRPPVLDAAATRAVVMALRLVAAMLFVVGLGAGSEHVAHTVRDHDIRLDVGQSTYRAVRELGAGRNPYREGMILDYESFLVRQPLRDALGFQSFDRATVEEYWRTMDPAMRVRFLELPAGMASPAARRGEPPSPAIAMVLPSFLFAVPFVAVVRPGRHSHRRPGRVVGLSPARAGRSSARWAPARWDAGSAWS